MVPTRLREKLDRGLPWTWREVAIAIVTDWKGRPRRVQARKAWASAMMAVPAPKRERSGPARSQRRLLATPVPMKDRPVAREMASLASSGRPSPRAREAMLLEPTANRRPVAMPMIIKGKTAVAAAMPPTPTPLPIKIRSTRL